MAAQDHVIYPPRGRVFTASERPGQADCAPSGRLRLDAIARWLQDVAYLDIEDAGVAQGAFWVVRRTRIAVARFPRFAEPLRLRTYCSRAGRMWAERCTVLTRDPGPTTDPDLAATDPDPSPLVEAVALWVHLDRETGEPTPLTPIEIEIYGSSISDWNLQARLRHPRPTGAEPAASWHFRATDCDLAGHVNNAAYWTVLEEELLQGPDPAQIDAEIEFRAASHPGEMSVLSRDPPAPSADPRMRWITAPSGDLHASIAVQVDGANAVHVANV